MRLDSVTPQTVRLTLSRRNLIALLSKIEVEDSARTIFKEYPVSHPAVNDGRPFTLTLYVTAEADDAHYEDRPPGEMVGWTEDFLGAVTDEDIAKWVGEGGAEP